MYCQMVNQGCFEDGADPHAGPFANSLTLHPAHCLKPAGCGDACHQPPGKAAGKLVPLWMPSYITTVTTSVSIQATCPKTCASQHIPGQAGQCYVSTGLSRIKSALLNQVVRGLESLEIMHKEVQRINAIFLLGASQASSNDRCDIRLHAAGAETYPEVAKFLAGAVTQWLQCWGCAAFMYSHRWRDIRRGARGLDISVLARVENSRGALHAWQCGYAPSLMMKNLPSDGRVFKTGAADFAPCPAQIQARTGAQCRLCFDERVLVKRKIGIAFRVHARDTNTSTGDTLR